MRIDRRSSKSKIANLYNRVAPQYDQVGPETFAIFGSILVGEAGLRPGMRVLDVASGRGAILFPATNLVGESGAVIGIDMAFEMLRLTRHLCQTRDKSNAALCLMDGEDLAFSAASFDAVLCGFAIFFLDLHKTLREWHRVLLPGGRVAVSMASGSDPQWTWYDELLRSFHEKYGFSLQPEWNKPISPSDVMNALIVNRFEQAELRVHEREIRYPDVETWWQSRWTHGSRYPLDQMSAEVLAVFKNEVFDNARRMQLVEKRGLACILARKPLD